MNDPEASPPVHSTAPPRPRARVHEIVERTVENNLLVYDLEQQRVHILNETAALIWQLCDGNHSTDEITTYLTRHFPEQQSAVERHVAETVQSFAEERLVTI